MLPKIASDPGLVEKRITYSICLQTARHNRYPNSSRYSPHKSSNDIITEDAQPLASNGDSVDAMEVDDKADLPEIPAEKENKPPSVANTVGDDESMAIPTLFVQKNSSKDPRKKFNSFESATDLDFMPSKLVVTNILSKPIKNSTTWYGVCQEV